jgi:hypothetical protein
MVVGDLDDPPLPPIHPPKLALGACVGLKMVGPLKVPAPGELYENIPGMWLGPLGGGAIGLLLALCPRYARALASSYPAAFSPKVAKSCADGGVYTVGADTVAGAAVGAAFLLLWSVCE